MGLSERPYIGTWRLNGTGLIQHTPDALVYLNGDTALPGCPKCNGRIDLQEFITEVSVDAGTEPGSASATFSLSIPLHHNNSFARDAKFLLRPGLEVHVYMRGYFPVKGLYSHLAEKRVTSTLGGAAAGPDRDAIQIREKKKAEKTFKIGEGPLPPTIEKLLDNAKFQDVRGGSLTARKPLTAQQRRNAETIYREVVNAGLPPTFALAAITQSRYEANLKETAINLGKKKKPPPAAIGLFQLNVNGGLGNPRTGFQGRKRAGTAAQAKKEPKRFYNAQDPTTNTQRILFSAKKKRYTTTRTSASKMFDTFYFSGLGAGNKAKNNPERVRRGQFRKSQGRRAFGRDWSSRKFNNTIAAETAELLETSQVIEDPADTDGMVRAEGVGAVAEKVTVAPSLLEELGLANQGIENVLAYPYYHTFHGVVTEVSHSYSGGVSTISVNCNSMLHFWQYQNMSTNASVFGARPTNSKNKMSMVGHNFTGMHPYQIMYTLHYDMVGAAGGVGWAMSSKSNQTAVSEVGQESLYSLNIKYWEKRFSGSIIKLRMHGATGELFTTMQAAFLGRTSSSRLSTVLRNRFNTSKLRDTTKGILQQAQTVGLYNKNRRSAIEATVQAFRSRPGTRKGDTNAPKFELNIVEMHAFVSNIGNWGQINLFESSYESKLDIAQKIMEMTGFEFFQDVDGDFVFKPPMYNLDTSSSRVYRIEDIDIINISYSEREPQVTYMTVKGSQFKNLQGTGTDGEWGVRGQYIDYRLVAQFGWRPGSYETAYFNDPKSMFFSAVNRMDIMNIGINSASVTIPERPELRPGYPVYIPYIDCFYYCNSFAHSHSVGGQCTTSLQLVGKRSKFFAPGESNNAGKPGIDSIDLGATTLPERPLEVVGLDGKPRLSGFPNVVMALDPNGINPLFFVVGADVENLNDTRVIRYLLESGKELGVLDKKEILGDGGAPTGQAFYTMDAPAGDNKGEGKGKKIAFFFQEGDTSGKASSPNANDFFRELDPGSFRDSNDVYTASVNVMKAAQDYSALLRRQGKKKESRQEEIGKTQTKINDLQAEIAEIQNAPDRHGSKSEKYVASITKKFKKISDFELKRDEEVETANRENAKVEQGWRSGDGKGEGVALLLRMLDEVGSQFRSERFKGRGDLTSTINLLDMLSDKKAIFSNGKLPGTYRYYSASHPDGDQQGPGIVTFDSRGVSKPGPPEDIQHSARLPRSEVSMYTRFVTSPFGGAKIPEAAFEQRKPTKGIKVLNSDPGTDGSFAGGQTVSTADIFELMFTVQDATVLQQVNVSVSTTNSGPLGKPAVRKIAAKFTLAGVSASVGGTVQQFFSGSARDVSSAVVAGVAALNASASNAGRTFKFTGGVSFPSTVTVYRTAVASSSTLTSYQYSGNPAGGLPLVSAAGAKVSQKTFVNKVGGVVARSFVKQIERLRRRAGKELNKAGIKGLELEEAISAFNRELESRLQITVRTKFKINLKKDRNKKTKIYSPVFPVSDHAGYTVIGSYRYGRGVTIEPQGVFDQLHKVDPLSLVDKNVVEQVLRFFVQGKGSVFLPELEAQEIGGVTRWVPVGPPIEFKGSRAATRLNLEMVRQLRAANLTDKQILDYGAALESSSPNQLDFSLANFFADEHNDGVQKLPVLNAAFSLADLTVRQGQHICDCKAAEAGVLIEAFGQQDFLSFSQSGTPHHEGLGDDPADAGTRFLAHSAALAAGPWKQNQDAVRGTVLDRGRSSVVRSFQDLGDRFDQAQANTQASRETLRAAQERLGVLESNVSTEASEDL